MEYPRQIASNVSFEFLAEIARQDNDFRGKFPKLIPYAANNLKIFSNFINTHSERLIAVLKPLNLRFSVTMEVQIYKIQSLFQLRIVILQLLILFAWERNSIARP